MVIPIAILKYNFIAGVLRWQQRSQKFLIFYITFMFLGCNYYAKNSIFTIGGGNFLVGVVE